jgi:hypothetical protein
MTTTLPSATDVTSFSSPTTLRAGTLKKKSTNPMKNMGMIVSGYESHAHGMNRNMTKASEQHIAQTRRIVP